MKRPIVAAPGLGDSKGSAQSCGHVIDDDFAFIEQLLNTLEAEESKEPDAGRPAPSPDFPPTEADTERKLSELDVEALGHETPGEQENWSTLLNRFCEDGDESIVDALLDSFLKSSGDVGHLIEEIDKGLPKKAECSERTGDLSLDLSQMRSPALETWEALLNSARGILHSARSHGMASGRSSLSVAVDKQASSATVTGKGEDVRLSARRLSARRLSVGRLEAWG